VGPQPHKTRFMMPVLILGEWILAPIHKGDSRGNLAKDRRADRFLAAPRARPSHVVTLGAIPGGEVGLNRGPYPAQEGLQA
jgi:hypothetical protein